ncbi:hypothetical protein TNCV_200261, partial [Trichonephila clavipes]
MLVILYHWILLSSILASNVHGPSTISSGIFKRLRFSPPLHEFVMLQYCSPLPKEPPIQGVFKML